MYSGAAALLFDGLLAENSGFMSYSYNTNVVVRLFSCSSLANGFHCCSLRC